MAFLAGGRVRGGRVVADWPGLGASDLLDGRDLRPTIATRQVFKAALHGGLGIPDHALEEAVFPSTESLVRPLDWFHA